MILTRLKLQNFRNYERLDLILAHGATLLHGANGAGKTNIVEAIFTLSATKSFRARSDRELINRGFDATTSPFPFARIEGVTESKDSQVRVEILIAGQTNDGRSGPRKQFRLDGSPKRASDIVGQIKAVLFSPSDVEIVDGAPSARRRFVDLMLCQVDPSYLRLLQSYTRIVQQRNGALTRVGGPSQAGLLEVWDQKLIEEGSWLMLRRQRMMEGLSELARDIYARLSSQAEAFGVAYAPSFDLPEQDCEDRASGEEDVIRRFREALTVETRRNSEARVTPVGPHRDDLTLTIDGEPLLAYGSRGQQRTAALAMRMAEARYIYEQTGRQPILLLDEALGELDEDRRTALLEFIQSHAQVILTGTSPSAYRDEFRRTARVFHVRSGTLSEAHSPAATSSVNIA